ncbi:serine/threonine protein kinase [Maudiozyma humilis]|uniref:Serine/threonine-protein kinase ATG1 n=1 Tax=Maudiozyma humilis TaxID=51915 RepID=A0AAV5RRC4_MAUHU|nr:serine/threonine protein kinase [Kazachstania humilis]
MDNTHPSIPGGKYIVDKEIGQGSFAVVYRGHSASAPQTHIAIKAVSKAKLKNKKLLENLEIEITILKKVRHPHIVRLMESERSATDFFLIMEYCALGDLTFLIKRRRELVAGHPLLQEMFDMYPPPTHSHNGLHQAFVLNYLQQLVSALQFLRSKNLVHRDIKPQNMLLSTPLIGYSTPQEFHAQGYAGIYNMPILKIADFGFARFLPNSSLAETLCGSPLYMAPEILNYQKYNAKADLWSTGAVLYEMCCGSPPFKANNHIELYKRIKRNRDNIAFPAYFDQYPADQPTAYRQTRAAEEEFHTINDRLRELIRGLLTFDPQARLGFDELFVNRLVMMDLSRYEAPPKVNHTLESKSRNLQESSMFVSEFLTPRAKQNAAIARSPEKNTSPGSKKKATALLPIRHTGANIHPPARSVHNSDLVLEKEYVVVEKKSVEVNELADEMARLGHGQVSSHTTYTSGGAAVGPTQMARITSVDSDVPATTTTNNYNNYNLDTERVQRQRSTSNNSNSSRRASLVERRLSINSLNPTNALSRALGIASTRLFGTNANANAHAAIGATTPTIFSPQMYNELTEKMVLRFNTSGDVKESGDSGTENRLSTVNDVVQMDMGDMVHYLETLSAKAFVIYAFAEVKYAQAMPLPGPTGVPTGTVGRDGKRLSTGSCALTDDDDDDADDQPHGNNTTIAEEPEIIDATLCKEAVSLYLKVLEILGEAMRNTASWWFKHRGQGSSSATGTNTGTAGTLSVRLNLLVQWIRDKFNDSLQKAETMRSKLVQSASVERQGNNSNDSDEMFLERLLYDRALEVAKNAARLEIAGNNTAACELAYATSLWMLSAVLDDTVPEHRGDTQDHGASSNLDTDDREIIQRYIESISGRLKALRSSQPVEQ